MVLVGSASGDAGHTRTVGVASVPRPLGHVLPRADATRLPSVAAVCDLRETLLGSSSPVRSLSGFFCLYSRGTLPLLG